jgi:anthranilate phosphoribosyltransferase
MDLHSLTRQLLAKQELSAEQVWAALHAMTEETSDKIAVAALLTAWRAKGETPNELSASCQWLRQRMVPVATGGLEVLDTCGTGGDELGTFNVSTAAALVTAACGVPVVKHGNRSVSSRSGSADVLERLGVPVELTAPDVAACLRDHGFAFCFAPRFHPVLAQVAEVRRRLGFRTIFNLLGPLLNPASAKRQLLGVGRPELLDLLAQTLARLGGVEALVVHGGDGLDEITLSGPTHVRKVVGGNVEATVWYPESFGLPRYPVEAFQGERAGRKCRTDRGGFVGCEMPGSRSGSGKYSSGAFTGRSRIPPDRRGAHRRRNRGFRKGPRPAASVAAVAPFDAITPRGCGINQLTFAKRPKCWSTPVQPDTGSEPTIPVAHCELSALVGIHLAWRNG